MLCFQPNPSLSHPNPHVTRAWIEAQESFTAQKEVRVDLSKEFRTIDVQRVAEEH